MQIKHFLFTTLLIFLVGCSSIGTASPPAGESPTTAVTETPAAVPTPEKITMSKWDLWSSGETMLRGADIAQGHVILELDGPTFKGPGPVGPPFTQEDFDRLAALGANYVTISGPGVFSIHPPYEPISELVHYYDNVLDMIARADMFATIGFRSGPGRADWSVCCAEDDFAQAYLVDTVWLDREAQAAWSEMWRFTAERYRTNPIVVGYKLMVEPNSAAFHLGIYDANEFYGNYADSTYDWNSFFPDIIAAIREVDSSTPILVSGDDFSSSEWLPYVTVVDDERTVYFVDQYAPHTYTHQELGTGQSFPGHLDTDFDGDTEDFDTGWLQSHLETIDMFEAENDRQVTVEEFGLVRYAPGAAEYLDELISLFEAGGLNYAIWEWASNWEEYTTSVSEFNWRFGPDPENVVDVENPLQDVLVSYWQRNTLRPSLVTWID